MGYRLIICYDVHYQGVNTTKEAIYTKDELVKFTEENPIHKIW